MVRLVGVVSVWPVCGQGVESGQCVVSLSVVSRVSKATTGRFEKIPPPASNPYPMINNS